MVLRTRPPRELSSCYRVVILSERSESKDLLFLSDGNIRPGAPRLDFETWASNTHHPCNKGWDHSAQIEIHSRTTTATPTHKHPTAPKC
jgi:hypothetical protein